MTPSTRPSPRRSVPPCRRAFASRRRATLLPGGALLLLGALLLQPGGVTAQLPGAGEPDTGELEALASALVGFELLWARVEPELSSPERVRADRAFDAASLYFFAGNTGAALLALDELALELDPEGDPDALRRLAFQRLQELNDHRQTTPTPRGSIPHLVARPDGPPPPEGWPVLVALHGAGGDERMFFGAYGAGRIADLAPEAGWLVVAPSTLAVARESGALQALLDDLGSTHPLDRSRLVLVGHSMGASTAWQEARSAPGAWAGVACLAGVCAPPADGSASPVRHLHLATGTHDPLVPAERVESGARRAAAEGVEVDLHLLDDRGHTLWVGEHLPTLMEWVTRIAPPTPGARP